MTREELQAQLADYDREYGKPEDPLTKWKREGEEGEAEIARERTRPRNLTDSEMQRWRSYFEDLVASERAATDTRIHEARQFILDVMGELAAGLREDITQEIAQAMEDARTSFARHAAIEKGQVTELPAEIDLRRHLRGNRGNDDVA